MELSEGIGGGLAGGDAPPAAALRVLDGPSKGKIIPIPASLADRPSGYILFRVGRGPENNLSFPDDSALSKRHAALYRVNGKWYCRDLDSINGTLIGGKRLRGNALPTPPGTEIRLGEQHLSLEYAPTSAMETAYTTKGSLASSEAATAASSPAIPFASDKKRPDAATAPAPKPASPWRWVTPGEAVTIRDYVIPGGMIYVGKSLQSLQGYGPEPALINPGLKIATRSTVGWRDVNRLNDRYSYSFYSLSYADLDQEARRWYLAWLAGGRSERAIPETLLLLFFYGLERRLLENNEEAAPPEERALLRAEIERLAAHYTEYTRFGHAAASLLSHLDTLRLLEDRRMPDIDALLALPRSGGELPLLLEAALSRIAHDKIPLPADFALAWVLHDPDTTSGRRTPAQRCPDEVRRLFLLRYAEEHPRGLRVTERKTPLHLSYRPASPSLYHWITQPAPGGLRAVGEAALKPLRTLLESCCDALDPYSRFLGKHPTWRESPLAAALLPPSLRGYHEGLHKLASWLDSQLSVTAEVTETADSSAGRVRLLKGSELLTALTGSFRSGDTLARAESLQATLLLEHLHIALEPDPRRGGSPLDGQDTVVLARLTKPPADETAATEAAEYEARLRPLLNLLASVLREVTEEKDKKRQRFLTLASRWGSAFADALERGDPARYAALLAYLFATPERIRVPRQLPVAASLTPEQRERFGTLLVYAAAEPARSNGGGYAPASPALVRQIAAGYRALGLSETLLYDRLHHQTTVTAPLVFDRSRHETQSSSATPDSEAIPSEEVRLDPAAIQRKVAETEQVSRLLDALFTDEQGQVIPSPPSEMPATLPAPDSSLLSGELHALLTELAAQDEWSAEGFAAHARAHGLLPGAALEAINEAAWEVADEPALEGVDPIVVNQEIVLLLLHQ